MLVARNPACPPGSCVSASANWSENPDCVSAHAMALADPKISSTAPDKTAVSTSIGTSLRQDICR